MQHVSAESGSGPADRGSTHELLLVADPMCAWCYGFRPVLERIRPELDGSVAVRLVLGGLAPDSEVPMDAAMRAYVQQAWRAVEATAGVPFEHRFWDEASPRRSTWPACRAVIAAGERGWALYHAIQQAYYREARDPSWPETLLALAKEVGCDEQEFLTAWRSERTEAALQQDFRVRDSLGATGFPSVGVRTPEKDRLLVRGWCDAPELLDVLRASGVPLASRG